MGTLSSEATLPAPGSSQIGANHAFVLFLYFLSLDFFQNVWCLNCLFKAVEFYRKFLGFLRNLFIATFNCVLKLCFRNVRIFRSQRL